MLLIPAILFTAIPQFSLCLDIAHYKHEGHSVMKRMADADDGYEGYDVARVHLVEGQGLILKRLTRKSLRTMADPSGGKRKRNLQLDLSSGPKVNLGLTSAGNVDSETLVSYLSGERRVARKRRSGDCFSYGEVEDASGKGWSAVSHCDGLFGFANSPGFEYYLHPVGVWRSRRNTDESYDVHVMWRRSPKSQIKDNATFYPGDEVSQNFLIPSVERRNLDLNNNTNDKRDIKNVVIEMAMFSDAQYWQRLQRVFPGRENDFLYIRLAATQALYSDPAKVGYDVQIKLKLLEYWTENPAGYEFIENLGPNMKSFCEYTRGKYFYDINVLNTGITKQANGLVGLAYVRGICTRVNCFASLAMRLDAFVVYDHELGHALGIGHPSSDKCPAELLPDVGFMGGGEPFNFSPCMKYQLATFFESGKGQCVFEETSKTTPPKGFDNLTPVLPGQIKSPDALCEILAGPGFNYLPFGKTLGRPMCQWMLCVNEDETNPAFGRARRFFAPIGFPCDDESFCAGRLCTAWKDTTMIFSVDRLRSMTHIPEWSEWSTDVSECSRSCGTGVRTRRRECQMTGFNLAPYCPGMAVKPELCNTESCPGESTKPLDQRQIRGDEVCSRFLKNNVQLDLKSARAYLPTSDMVTTIDAGATVVKARSRSCLLKCNRVPANAEGDLDALMPDGTPCLETSRAKSEMLRLKIDLRCVRGYCTEFCEGLVNGCKSDKRGIADEGIAGSEASVNDSMEPGDGDGIKGDEFVEKNI